MRPQVEIRNCGLRNSRQDTLRIKRCVFANIFSCFRSSFHSVNLLYCGQSFWITALDLFLESVAGGKGQGLPVVISGFLSPSRSQIPQ
jgi:hypothetical protein